MKNLYERTFVKENVTKTWLQSVGFRYNRNFSDKDEDVYTYRFAVHKYKTIPTLECELCIFSNNGEVRINVYDCRLDSTYPLFYNSKNITNGITIEISYKIEQELKRLGIREVKNDRNKKCNNRSESKKTKK